MNFLKTAGLVALSTFSFSTVSIADSRLSLLQEKVDSCNSWYADAQKQYDWFGNVWKNGARGYRELLYRGDVIMHEDYDMPGSGFAKVSSWAGYAAVQISCPDANACVQVETKKWTSDGQSKGTKNKTDYSFLLSICPSIEHAKEISSLYNKIYP